MLCVCDLIIFSSILTVLGTVFRRHKLTFIDVRVYSPRAEKVKKVVYFKAAITQFDRGGVSK